MSDCTLCRDGYPQCGPFQADAVEGTDPPLCEQCVRLIEQNNAQADKSIAEDWVIKVTRLEYRPCPDEGGFMRWGSVGSQLRLCIWCLRGSLLSRDGLTVR